MRDDIDLNPLAKDVAKHLHSFEYQPDPHGNGRPRLVAANGMALYLTQGWDTPARVIVAASYPDAKDVQVYGGPRHEITVALSRGGEVLAREITRRLLPGYLEDFNKVVKRIEAARQQKAERETLAESLINAMPGASRLSSQDGYATVWFNNGKVELSSSGYARWTFSTDDPSLNLAIARLIGHPGRQETT